MTEWVPVWQVTLISALPAIVAIMLLMPADLAVPLIRVPAFLAIPPGVHVL
jgi:hypothetical protein